MSDQQMSTATLPDQSGESNSWKETGDDVPYRIVSRAAVLSLILAILGILSFLWIGLAILPAFGVVAALTAIMNIRKYPQELTGLGIARTGLAGSLLILFATSSYHTYTYLTEVPEGYQRVAFSSLTNKPNQPDYPPEDALQLDGKQIFIKGYIHPSSLSTPQAKKFVLVPDLGTCCFGGQPPITHMIEVTLTGNKTVRSSYKKLKLAGTLKVDTQIKPIKELQGVYYQLKADYLQ
jgi:hypothetical protein